MTKVSALGWTFAGDASMDQDGVIGVNSGFAVSGVGFSRPFTTTSGMMLAFGQRSEAGVRMALACLTAAGFSGTFSEPAGGPNIWEGILEGGMLFNP